MPEKTQKKEPIAVRRRLVELKQRLKQVATAWTVDDYEAFVGFYVRLLPHVMEAERCTVYIIEMSTERICSMFGTGIEKMQIRPPHRGSVAGETISSGKSMIRNNLQAAEGYHTKVDAETGFITRNVICCPIKSLTGHGVSGAVQVLNKVDGQFTEADLDLCEEAANYLATSIESIILNQEILRISKQLNSEYERLGKGFLFETPFVADSAAMKGVLEQVQLVSQTPVNVLIQGENGTGKELVARMIHEQSIRRSGPLVAVNCAAIPETLMESEFFGYEKGAFTGAFQRRKGRFEEAAGGTLFLDEIADMPASIQPKFLRVLQEGEGSRLGSNTTIAYDIRLISASNKDLRKEVAEGRFREDLFFRLFAVEIFLPPLRQRREDIVPLSMAFLEDVCNLFEKSVKGFSVAVLDLFENYHWPGNIRELRQEVERQVALTRPGERITEAVCSPALRTQDGTAPERFGEDKTLPQQVKMLEMHLIGRALQKSGGNLRKASDALGITRQGLYKKLKRYGIDRP